MASSGLKHDVNLSLEGDYDSSLLITGVTGNGKSTLCNFLCCSKTAFEAHSGFASVTAKSAAAIITMQSKRIKLIDTPGFCDDFETEEEHMKEFGEALVLASKGVNAIGLVISAKARYTSNEANTIQSMTEFHEMWSHMFIIFTNAGSLGDNDQERAKQLEDSFKQDRCPSSLKDLIHKVNKRYILIESVKPTGDPEAYYQLKTEQLNTMIAKMNEANNNRVYTNALFRRAKEIIDKLIEEKEKEEKELVSKMEEAKLDAEKIKENTKSATLSKQQIEIITKKREDFEKDNEIKRTQTMLQTQTEVRQKSLEKENVQNEVQKRRLEKQAIEKETNEKLEEQRKRKIRQEAQTEAMEKLNELLVNERRINEELQGKRNRKWYKVLVKKTTGKDCVIQ